MEVLICLFFAASIFLIASYFLGKNIPDERSSQFEREIKEKKRTKGFIIPIKLMPIIAPLNRPLIKLLGGEETLKLRLAAGTLRTSINSFLFIKEVLAIGLPLGLYILVGPGIVKPIWLIAAGILGFLLPDLYLKNLTRKRKMEIIKHLPDTIDLLSLCVGGGLDFITGIKWVIERSKPSALIDEFLLVFRELEVGGSRQEAFRNMGKRLDIPEINSFVRTVIQADRMGVSVGEILSVLSDEVRRQRFQRGERMALKAPIKMLFPLIFFILPVIGIVVGAPVMMQFMQQSNVRASIMGK
jgi:tight adherence protein C